MEARGPMTISQDSSASREQSADCSAGNVGRAVAPDVAAARAVGIASAVQYTEVLPLLDAAGRVLAAPARSPHAVPPFDTSAMDGYAVRTAGFTGPGPWSLKVEGRRAAGDRPCDGPATPDTCLRIFTGAPVPPGFDAVVMQERCVRTGDDVTFDARPQLGHNIRFAGEDIAADASLLTKGALLSAPKLALLAGAGLGEVAVFRKIRIALISTGSELREPGQPLAPGQIHNSNRILLRAMLADCNWADVRDFGIVADDRAQLEQVFAQAAADCDAIVTTGGVSAGDEDHVAAVLRNSGGELDVVQVAMRPGKPVKIGRIRQALFVGLPGNPNAALVTFRRIAMPALRALAGLAEIDPVSQPVIAGFSYAKRKDRTEFVPARLTGRTVNGIPVIERLARGSSASLSAAATADGIALLPPGDEAIDEGALLQFEPF